VEKLFSKIYLLFCRTPDYQSPFPLTTRWLTPKKSTSF